MDGEPLEPMRELHFIFDGPPGPEGPRLVDVENENGYTLNPGEWRQRSDGLWELVVKIPETMGP